MSGALENFGLLLGLAFHENGVKRQQELQQAYINNPSAPNYFKKTGYKSFYDLENKYAGLSTRSIENKFSKMHMDTKLHFAKQTLLFELNLLRENRDEVAKAYGIVVSGDEDVNEQREPISRDQIIGFILLFSIFMSVVIYNQ